MGLSNTWVTLHQIAISRTWCWKVQARNGSVLVSRNIRRCRLEFKQSPQEEHQLLNPLCEWMLCLWFKSIRRSSHCRQLKASCIAWLVDAVMESSSRIACSSSCPLMLSITRYQFTGNSAARQLISRQGPKELEGSDIFQANSYGCNQLS